MTELRGGHAFARGDIRRADREVFTLPGISHRTLADRADGLGQLEVWLQNLEPGAESPAHYHECEEVIVVLSGRGRLVVAGEEKRFESASTLIVPAGVVHQLINDGDRQVKLIAALAATPARAFGPDGSLIPLPWQA